MLMQNYPNPMSKETKIRFQMPEMGHVKLCIYNISGQLVKTLADGCMNPGAHALSWDGKDESGKPVGAGVYLYRIEAGASRQVKRLTVIK